MWGWGVVKLSEFKAMLSSGKFLKKSQKDEIFLDHSIKYMDCSSGGLELEMNQWDIWQKLDSELPDALKLGTW